MDSKSKYKRRIWLSVIVGVFSILSTIVIYLLNPPSGISKSTSIDEVNGPIIVGDNGTIVIQDDNSRVDTAMLNYCTQIRDKARFQLNKINKLYKTEGSSDELLIVAGHRDQLNKIIHFDCETLLINQYEIEDSLNVILNVYK